MFVCMFGHNSGTPGAISTKLGIHIAICMYKNLMYILYIYLLSINLRREDGVGGLHGIHPQGLPIAAAVTFTQIGIEATARLCCARTCVHFYLGTSTAVSVQNSVIDNTRQTYLWNAWSDFNQTWYTYGYMYV
jgi:hypothetical protein